VSDIIDARCNHEVLLIPFLHRNCVS